MSFSLVCAFAALFGGGPDCDPSDLGGRLVIPPRADLSIGSLYYVRERSTQSFQKAANLFDLCTTNPERWSANVIERPSPDISLTRKVEDQADVSAIANVLGSVGLRGGFATYFEYKLTNAVFVTSDLGSLERMFEGRASEKECVGWQTNIRKYGWAAYQLQAYYKGDLSLQLRNDISLSADAQAQLKAVDAKLKAALSQALGTTYQGRAIIPIFVPIPRD